MRRKNLQTSTRIGARGASAPESNLTSDKACQTLGVQKLHSGPEFLDALQSLVQSCNQTRSLRDLISLDMGSGNEDLFMYPWASERHHA